MKQEMFFTILGIASDNDGDRGSIQSVGRQPQVTTAPDSNLPNSALDRRHSFAGDRSRARKKAVTLRTSIERHDRKPGRYPKNFPLALYRRLLGRDMHRCEMEVNGRLALPCGDRATVKIEEHWYCQLHADALEQAEQRWSGVNWFPLTYGESEKQLDFNDEDGVFWDNEEEWSPRNG